MLREIQASEAKAKLAEILDRVERGETVVITRHGSRIARIVPEREGRAAQIEQAIAGIRQIGERTKRVSLAELLSSRDEGRKH